jgi:3-oxoacyl-[acyl-carrier protein] reductase
MSDKFYNKNVMVTGGSRGIGAALVQSFLAAGANVVNLSQTQNDQDFGKNYTFVKSDVNQIPKIQNWIKSYPQQIDIWINNAGVYPQAKLKEVTPKSWDQTFNTNLKSLFFISQAVAEKMKKNGGVILNAASFAGTMPSIGSGIYAASKAGVISLTKSMAAEWAKFGIRVNCYSPGLIMTDMTREIINKHHAKAMAPIAIGREGEATEIAEPLLFLCSDQASYITGINLDISGGKFIVQNQSAAS